MTTRQGVNRTLRRGFLGVIIGFAVCFGGAILASQIHRTFIVVSVVGFVLAGASILYLSFAGRCIHRQRLLTGLFSESGGSPFNMSRDLQFCPYCGKSLDDDVAI